MESTSPDTADRGTWRWLVGLVAAWIATRAILVLSLADVFFWGEELEKGTVATWLGAKFRGELDVPWHLLPYHPYEGGGFFASHMKLVAFALVGENVLAHKLCAILWGAVFVAATFRFARRHLGPAAARWSGLFLVFGPLHWQRESLLHLGIHFEALVFVVWVFDRALRIAGESREGAAGRVDLVVLGLAGGFGLWFSYQLALPLGLVLLLLLLSRPPARWAPEGGVALGAFVVGAAPLVYMAARLGSGVLDLHGSEVGGAGGFERLGTFLASLFEAVRADPAALVAAAALALLIALAPVRHGRGAGRAIALLATYAALWLVAAGRSGLVPGKFTLDFALLRWAPVVFVALLVAAAGAGGSGRLGHVARVLGCAVVLSGAAQMVRLAAEGDPASLAENLRVLREAPGSAPVQAAMKVVPRQPGELAERASPFVDAGPTDGERVALAAASVQDAPDSFEPVIQAFVARDPEGRNAYILGLGAALLYEVQGDPVRALELAALHPPDEARLRAAALGRAGTGWWLPPSALEDLVERTRSAPEAASFREGLGRALFHTLVLTPGGVLLVERPTLLRPEAARALVRETLEADAAADVLRGFDAEAATWGREPLYNPER